MQAGIVTGLVLERKLLEKRSSAAQLVTCHGPGFTAATRAANALLADGAEALASFGLAGALTDAVTPGTLVLPEVVRVGRDDVAQCHEPWRNAVIAAAPKEAAFHDGPLASLDDVVATPEAKLALHYQTGAVAVDMESAAVGAVAARVGVPFISVRAVADPHDMALPRAAIVSMRPDGTVNPWRLFWSVVTSPRQLQTLTALGAHSGAAMAALGDVADKAGSALATPPDPRAGLIRQLRAVGGSRS